VAPADQLEGVRHHRVMDWIEELKVGKRARLWDAFTPANPQDVAEIEDSIRRPLPEDFSSFYLRIGFGPWPHGGGIFSPGEIVASIGAPIYLALGSLMSGQEWATKAQHRQLWLSQGKDNPDPRRFTQTALTFHGMTLTDLLEIGTDGSAGYQMLNLSASSAIQYFVAYESSQIDLQSGSFREGIRAITQWLLG